MHYRYLAQKSELEYDERLHDHGSRPMPEPRFVLTDFTCPAVGGARLYEAGHSYPMSPVLAHAAAKRDLVSHRKPPHWAPPSLLSAPVALTTTDIEEAGAELEALARHAVEAPAYLDA